ncbi:hypothetical protein ACO0K3_04915 [Undibacterium sp. Rencai35W]|uniref:hypothetical protein n=1 Tax=Undibacterium sp. Rencai35W TaxID=3413046 RepID=UPI003BF41798
MAGESPGLTRPSLQLRHFGVVGCARVAVYDCDQHTPGALRGIRASSWDCDCSMPAAPASGYLDNLDRASACHAANAVGVHADSFLLSSNTALGLADAAETADRMQNMTWLPW